MSDMAEIITAGTGAVGLLGGGIGFLWRRVEKGFREVKEELAKCQRREKRAAETTAKQLTVIELLWQSASKNKAAAPTLERCKHLLDELKRPPERDDEND